MRIPVRSTVAVAALVLSIGAGVSSASAASPWWRLQSGSRPSYLAPEGSGHVVATLTNVGNGSTSGGLTIADTLPAGLTAKSIEALVFEGQSGPDTALPLKCVLGTLTCTFGSVERKNQKGELETVPEQLLPYAMIEVRIAVGVQAGATTCVQNSSTCEQNEVSVTGGGAPSSSIRRALTVSEQPTPFGVESYEVTPEEEGGAPATQAGKHPYQVTGTLTMNQTASSFANEALEVFPVALPRDLAGLLPPGLIGNPTPFARCTNAQFYGRACPEQSVVGVAVVSYDIPNISGFSTVAVPIVNLEPTYGEPARFGFIVVESAAVFIDAHVRTGGDYGITLSSTDITQLAGFIGYKLTFWGVPGQASHDNVRGSSCLSVLHGISPATLEAEGSPPCDPLGENKPPPLLAMPTSCTGPLHTSTEADSWEDPKPEGQRLIVPETAPMPAMQGCNRLPFEPQIKVTPDGTAASSPTGLTADVHVPQESILNGTALAQSAVKQITVALPEGVAVNPAGSDGLQACSESLVGFEGFKEYETSPGITQAAFTPALPAPFEPGVDFCADAAKIGTAEISTPLLPAGQPLTGSVYLATQNENPFGSLIAIYLVVEDPISGTVVKLPGETHLTESGQIVATFKNNPQLAFEDATLHFFGGERGPLATPARCGSYTTNASFVPWAAEPWDEAAVTTAASSTFSITSGPHGSPCPGASLPFAPTFTGGTTNINAGSFSPLTTTIGREDGSENIQSVQLHLPEGLGGLLANVKLCPEAQANEGTCGPESEIGETVVSAGVGNDPVTVTGGKVFITEKYAGAPFGLSIVNPVKAGPFDLERDTANPAQNPPCDCVVVRAKVEVDPHTTELTVTTDPSGPHAIPHLIDGIPVQIKKVNVTINREKFTFNPTNCNPTSLTGTIASDEGAAQPLTVAFQATNCASLRFAPSISFSTNSKTSKQDGAELITKVTYPSAPQGTYADVGYVKVELPKALPSRLSTIQKACLASVFDANPAACPSESRIGYATVHTPLLPVPLTGPAIFVSHGDEAFPSLTMVLQGYGVTVDLVGTTFISKAGITSTTFKTVPDQPFSSFELVLPQGPYSALTANGNLCTQKLVAPNELLSQAGGAPLRQNSTISVTGCPPAITVVSHKVAGKTATIEVSVPAAGTLVATGKGLSRARKTAAGASTLTVKLTLTGGEAAALSKHNGRKLKARINLTFTPKKGKKLTTSTTVIVG